MSIIENNLGVAGDSSLGVTHIPQLFAGDTPALQTTDVLIPGAHDQHVPLGPGYAAWAPGQPIIALTAYKVAAGKRAAPYTAGCFNIDAIRWPSGTTEAQVQTATEQSQLKFRKLLYSDKRTGNEVLGKDAGPAIVPIT